MICRRHPWNRIRSCICLDRRSEQGAASLLKGLMLPRQPVSHDSNECETPCRVKMLALVGYYRRRRTELCCSQEKNAVESKLVDYNSRLTICLV